MNKLITVVGLIMPLSLSYAAGLDIKVGEEAVAAKLNTSDPAPGSAAELAFVYNNDLSAKVINAGLFVTGKRNSLQGRVGAKAYLVDLGGTDGHGVALGGDVSYPLGNSLSIEGGAYFGPGSLAFNDLDRYREWYMSISFELFDNAKLAAGVGSLEVESSADQTIEVDDGLFIEMKLRFN